MNKTSIATGQQLEDAELAAALAAVAAFVETAGSGDAPDDCSDTTSKWRAASLLEGVSSNRSSARKPGAWNAWKAALSLPLIFAICSALMVPSKAVADEDVAVEIDTTTVALHRPVKQAFEDSDDELESDSRSSRTVIRVGLALGQKSIAIEAPDGATVMLASTGAPIASLPPQTRWSLVPTAAGTIAFRAKGSQDTVKLPEDVAVIEPAAFLPNVAPNIGKVKLPADLLAAVAPTGGYLIVPKGSDPDEQVLSLNGKLYRGALLVKNNPSAGGTVLNVINVLDLEAYLLSVLPSEMPCTWPSGALQAQAIAARSYAIANLGKHSKEGYDLRATVDDQVYLGVSSERHSSNDAVSATAGLVLKHAGKPISAFFHSTSGGSTELSENVWGRALPYLKSVVDYDDGSPHFNWTRKVQNDDIEKIFGKDIGQILAMFVVARTPATTRARTILLVGTGGTKLINGDALRLALKLPSSNFNIGCEENFYSFVGRGFGHGLGMSQYGAKALAEQGYNAAQILAYYYKDVSVEYAAGPPGI